MKGMSSQMITVQGCNGSPEGSTNLSCCLMQGVSGSTCLPCDNIATGDLELEVSVAEWLLLSGSILLANGALTGVLGIVAGFTGISGSRFVGVVGCSDVLQIPWLFLWRSTRSCSDVHVSHQPAHFFARCHGTVVNCVVLWIVNVCCEIQSETRQYLWISSY